MGRDHTTALFGELSLRDHLKEKKRQLQNCCYISTSTINVVQEAHFVGGCGRVVRENFTEKRNLAWGLFRAGNAQGEKKRHTHTIPDTFKGKQALSHVKGHADIISK